MTDQPPPSGPAPGTAVATTDPAAPRAVRSYEPVSDVIPIYDTSRFEHYQRIATIMAAAPLVPDDLRGAGGAAAVGNCFMVVGLADRLGMDPFMLAQCCSVVHGKLMLEGKVVDAALRGKRKIALNFYFTGDRGTDARRIYASREKLTQEQVEALRPGVYPYGHEDMIDGSIGDWKTKEKGGAVKAAWQGAQSDIQLRYRATRVWARVNDPGIMLGVYTEDEFDEIVERRETPGRIEGPRGGAAPRLTAGFGDETDERFRSGARAEAPKPAEPDAPAPTEPAEGAAHERQSRDDQLMAMFDLGREAFRESQPRSAPNDLDDDEAERWLEGWDSMAEERMAEDSINNEPVEDAAQTVAPADVVYMLKGETHGENGRRKTYKNGFSHSTVTETGAQKLTEYDLHTPLPDDEEERERQRLEAVERQQQGASGDAAPGEPTAPPTPSPDSSADSPPAEDQPNGGQTATNPPPADEDRFPGDPEPKVSDGTPFGETHAKIGEATTWAAVKDNLRALAATDAYRDCEKEGRRMVRMWAWDRYVELRDEGGEAIQPTADITLFRFWLEFASENADQITSFFRALHKSDAYAAASDADKTSLGQLIAERKDAFTAAKT